MKLHKEGIPFIVGFSILIVVIFYSAFRFDHWLSWFLFVAFLIIYIICILFFRNPTRPIPNVDNSLLYSPADGKIVAYEKIVESEYFNKEMIQLSVFLSLFDVHFNKIPFSGQVTYSQYHAGKYLAAWNPKSSSENERHCMAIENKGNKLFMRQIAGLVARRVVTYPKLNDYVKQGEELGFMKFGSRMDIIVPLDTEILVNIGDKVKANTTILAKFKN